MTWRTLERLALDEARRSPGPLVRRSQGGLTVEVDAGPITLTPNGEVLTVSASLPVRGSAGTSWTAVAAWPGQIALQPGRSGIELSLEPTSAALEVQLLPAPTGAPPGAPTRASTGASTEGAALAEAAARGAARRLTRLALLTLAPPPVAGHAWAPSLVPGEHVLGIEAAAQPPLPSPIPPGERAARPGVGQQLTETWSWGLIGAWLPGEVGGLRTLGVDKQPGGPARLLLRQAGDVCDWADFAVPWKLRTDDRTEVGEPALVASGHPSEVPPGLSEAAQAALRGLRSRLGAAPAVGAGGEIWRRLLLRTSGAGVHRDFRIERPGVRPPRAPPMAPPAPLQGAVEHEAAPVQRAP